MKHLEIAIKEIGNKEIPLKSNWGIHVEKYLLSININFPASWCMAFVYWCCEEVNPFTPLVQTGGVLKQWNEVNPKYKFAKPQAGDIFIMDFGKGLGHTGFVESVGLTTINTIEGNASTITGSREGVEVCRKVRKISLCKGFIRL